MDHPDNLSKKTASIKIPANPCILIIFGIAGDLTKRLLIPALCNLGSTGLLNKNFSIIGIAKTDYTTDSFRNQLINNINEFVKEPSAKQYGLELVKQVHYISGDFSDENTFTQLKNKLTELENQKASKNCLFYFAAPPKFMETIALGLHKANLLLEKEDAFKRMVIEKPFGHDFHSAKKLNALLRSIANEKQIFRIDHFLGKETVRNLLTFRFSNSFFEPVWNRLYIDHVQITVSETLGVEKRGNYYEQTGAMRDMMPNHLFQMLSLITMEPPALFNANDIQAEKEKVLRSMQKFTPEQVLSQMVRGQYQGYRSEENVAPDSSTETFIALKLFIENWRWLDVPFYLRTGKCMKERQSEIVIQFKLKPSTLFNGSEQQIQPNILRLFIQPSQGISLQFNSKVPDPNLEISQVNMNYRYSEYFDLSPQTGYEPILYECMNGDHLLFTRADIVETEWALVQPILDVFSSFKPLDFPNYEKGSWGPKEADELIKKDGREWLL